MKLTKSQIEILKRMRSSGRHTIYIGYLGTEGLGMFGMTITFKIRSGTAQAFIKQGIAVANEDRNRVTLTEYGKTCELPED